MLIFKLYQKGWKSRCSFPCVSRTERGVDVFSYLVFFKSRDADAITAAFQEFASRKMSRDEKPSIRERLAQAREQAAQKVEHRALDREKIKVKERGVEL